MVYVTERAREVFKLALDDLTEETEMTLRLGQTPAGSLGVFPDTEKDGDQVIDHEGQTVLLIGREVSEALAGRTIDVEETDEGFKFVLKR